MSEKAKRNEVEDKNERKEKMAENAYGTEQTREKNYRYWEGVKSRKKKGGKN